MSLTLVFMGTPDFAVPTLAALLGAGHRVAAVYTRAPAPAGRGMALRPSPVQALAEARGVPVLAPRTLREEAATAAFRAHGADLAVAVAYGLILPEAILAAPRLGCLNLHASLLPRWRGAAPIQRAIMAGDAETGVAVMRMEAGLDTGPVALEARVPIPPDADSGALHDDLARRGADLMVDALAGIEAGTLGFRPQAEGGVTYAAKITNAEARLDWRESARVLHDRVRGLSPFPGAHFLADLGRGEERVRLLAAAPAAGEGPPGTLLDAAGTVACGAGDGGGALRLLRLQRGGRPPAAAEDFLRGARLPPGTVLR